MVGGNILVMIPIFPNKLVITLAKIMIEKLLREREREHAKAISLHFSANFSIQFFFSIIKNMHMLMTCQVEI